MKPPRLQPAFLLGFALLATLVGISSPILAQNAAAGRPAVAYRIRAADKLGIRIFQEEDLSIVPRVDAKGTVNLTLVGELRIAGMTVNEAEQAIVNIYRERKLLRNPRVTVTVEEYASREVSVSGMVKEPKRYALPLESTMTVLELVTKAGGFTDTAQGKEVRLTRIMPDGSTQTQILDIDSLIKGKKNAKAEDSSLLLEPGDIIYVPERRI